jgi:class 3 adenylate cyclase/tetratricopeptide (TPR) repeat protein
MPETATGVRIAPEPSEPSPALEGERKTVTALFADIKGSTELMEDLDPEEARAIIDPALKLMIDAVRHYDGYIVQSAGDGILALFGAPAAHEDHPQRAICSAIRIQEDIRRYGDKLRSEGRAPLAIRVGANTGEVVLRSIATGSGHVEYTPIGHTINLASRMQTLATPGSIAIAEPTRKLVEGYFQLKGLGPARLKGITEPVHVFEVTGYGPLRTRLQRSASRGYTKFVGRLREIDAMKHAAELAKSGHGQIVAAIGEPGVGKSRLMYEFTATSQSGFLVLEAVSFSHGKATAYLPAIDLLQGYFKIAPEDDERAKRAKVTGNVLTLDRALEGTLPYLFALLSIVEGDDPLAQMDPQIRRRRTGEAIKRILLRESLNQPLMLVFEDLHWIDEETQAFLNLLAEGIANAPVLLLVNYRPEYSHTWASKSYYRQLRLDPLGKQGAEEMLSALLSDGPELVPLKRMVLERTQGNPLFMEELVQALFDEGALVRNGAVKVTKSLSQLRIPPTVQGILAARIDRLPAEEKDLLQTLAVIGMEFPLALIREVVKKPDDELNRMLNDLQLAEFVYEQPAAGDIGYSFKHALTHDVAYNSLLTERRKLLHERAAQGIEALYREGLENHYADLAHHYRSSSNAAKAIEYLHLAGEQAMVRGAYAQALANVEPALSLIERLPEGQERLRAELRVRLLQGRVVTVLYGVSSAERLQTFERVCDLSERLGDSSALLRGLLNIAFAYSNRGEALRAREIGARCLELAEQRSSSGLLPIIHLRIALSAYHFGDLLQASSQFSDLMKRFASAQQGAAAEIVPVNAWVLVPAWFAHVRHALGRPDEALKLMDEALRRGSDLKQPFSLASALEFAALLRHQRREPEAARELAETEIALAKEHGFRERLIGGRAIRGWAMTEVGQMEDGIAELESIAAAALSLVRIWASAMLAHVYTRVGRADRALAMLDQELARFERSGSHLREPELHRLKGEALLGRDSSAIAEAEACFRRAIEIAKGQSAKWWELRATVSLARLLAPTGRRDEARTMLAEIYGWFTEGFDTADLKDAKALLDELRR